MLSDSTNATCSLGGTPQAGVRIPLGRGSIEASVPNLLAVMRPESIPGVSDPASCVGAALTDPIGCKPLAEMSRGHKDAVIVVNDITRPYPGQLLVLSIAKELARAGITDDRIPLVVAYGNHRRNTPSEIHGMFGDEVVSRFRIVHHDGGDEASLKYIRTTPGGVPLYINRVVAEASLKIVTGLITPHHSAGFSGGRKSIVPGVAGLKTLNVHHSLPIRPYEPAMGWYEGNAFHEEALFAARAIGVDFMVNTVDNADRELVAVVAGDVDLAHREGVKICERIWKVRIPEKADVVIASPGGYPRDFDLHQSQKALSCAEMAVKPGGILILCAEARDGIGKFGRWLKDAATPEDVIERYKREGYTAEASSKAFMYARAFSKHKVMIVGCRVAEQELREMFFDPKPSLDAAISAAIAEKSAGATFIVIPYASDMYPVAG